MDLNWNNLDKYTIKAFCQENNIKLIIDTCHPHAQIIWQLGINYATLTNIPYLHPIKKSVLS
ncbi:MULTISPECIES: precorrin-6A/cobalt-precorrin-6A reductase [Microcystis]|uniref:precorrin-6A/cobalt-precorrin-6A reductase n=1 Tax=Microcystis TaxID=1125 RepID=UPI0030CB9C2C